jgi:predicted dehydrogenase
MGVRARDPKKLALLGCGGMVYSFIYEYTKSLGLSLEGVCGSDEEVRRFSRMYAAGRCFHDYRELLEAVQPDMVIVYPQDAAAQYEMTRAALRSGADVLCERPVCHSIAEGEELVELQNETGHFVMPRYNRRYMPAYTSAARILGSPEFGRARMYSSSFHAAPYGSEGEFVANHISHHLDLARMLLGEIRLLNVTRVFQDTTRVGYNLVFESEGGTLGNIQSCSFLCGDYPMERLDISGDGRQIVVDNVRFLRYNAPVTRLADSGAVDFLAPGGTRILNENFAQLNNHVFYGFEHMLREFYRCASAGVFPRQDMADTLKTFRLVQELSAWSGGSAT